MEKITISCADLSIESEDVVKVRLFDDIDFEIKEAGELLNAIKQLTAGKKFYLLTQTNESFTATSEVREYVAENIASTGIIANAICLKSLPIRFIINAYVKFNKPNVPTKTFNSESTALEWIDEIRKSNIGKEILSQNKKSKTLMY
ncbi:MAG: hypothetical protein K0S53_2055 [Bacteroidetes bacterium]|jgi:hypothetical protein|nr:hypothetical protein [Bacteroidota bacterium]MDF2452838.1 hypothetical protein [Bacteroidota bacterium]